MHNFKQLKSQNVSVNKYYSLWLVFKTKTNKKKQQLVIEEQLLWQPAYTLFRGKLIVVNTGHTKPLSPINPCCDDAQGGLMSYQSLPLDVALSDSFITAVTFLPLCFVLVNSFPGFNLSCQCIFEHEPCATWTYGVRAMSWHTPQICTVQVELYHAIINMLIILNM